MGIHYAYTICCLTADGAKYVSGYDEAGKEITYLASPTLSVSSTSSGKPRLSWTRVSGATEYYVYRSVNGSEFTYQYTTTNTYYTNVATYSGNTHGYYVVAVCGDSEYRSAASGAVSFAVR